MENSVCTFIPLSLFYDIFNGRPNFSSFADGYLSGRWRNLDKSGWMSDFSSLLNFRQIHILRLERFAKLVRVQDCSEAQWNSKARHSSQAVTSLQRLVNTCQQRSLSLYPRIRLTVLNENQLARTKISWFSGDPNVKKDHEFALNIRCSGHFSRNLLGLVGQTLR